MTSPVRTPEGVAIARKHRMYAVLLPRTGHLPASNLRTRTRLKARTPATVLGLSCRGPDGLRGSSAGGSGDADPAANAYHRREASASTRRAPGPRPHRSCHFRARVGLVSA